MARRLDKLTKTHKVSGVACLTTMVFVLAPSLIWILSDRSIWGWDPAHYGYWTLRIWHARSGGLWSWLDAMLHSLGSMPPLLAWLGQFFVPLQHVTGDLESALLQMNLMMAAATLILVYVTVRRLGGDTLSSMAAVLACGGSAIFIGLTHRYMVEITQAFAVTAVAFVALRAERRSSMRTFGLLAMVVAVSLLSKASSVTFVLPLLGYVALALFTARRRPRPATRPVDVAVAAAAIVVVAATLSWYVVNWAPMVHHLAQSVSGENALRYGSPVHPPMKLTYWSYSLGRALSVFGFVSLGILTVVAVACGAEARRLVRLGAGRVEQALDDGTLFAAAVASTDRPHARDLCASNQRGGAVSDARGAALACSSSDGVSPSSVVHSSRARSWWR